MAPKFLQNDLVGHWKFDEISGTTAHDSSGNEYDATFEQVTMVRGWMERGAIDLDGSNDYFHQKSL